MADQDHTDMDVDDGQRDNEHDRLPTTTLGYATVVNEHTRSLTGSQGMRPNSTDASPAMRRNRWD